MQFVESKYGTIDFNGDANTKFSIHHQYDASATANAQWKQAFRYTCQACLPLKNSLCRRAT